MYYTAIFKSSDWKRQVTTTTRKKNEETAKPLDATF